MDNFSKSSSPELRRGLFTFSFSQPISTKLWHKASMGERVSILLNKSFLRGDILKILEQIFKSLLQNLILDQYQPYLAKTNLLLWIVSQVSGVALGPLIYLFHSVWFSKSRQWGEYTIIFVSLLFFLVKTKEKIYGS